jgi:hypothetical protein
LSKSELNGLCPWLWSAIEAVENEIVKFPDPQEQEDRCLIQAEGSLLAILFRITSAVKLLASFPLDDKNNLLLNQQPIYKRWCKHPVTSLPFFRSTIFFDICTRVQQSQKQSALYLENEPTAQHKSWFGVEVQKNVLPKLNHNIRLSQSLITGQREFRDQVLREIASACSSLDTLNHNVHAVDSTIDSIWAQNALIISQNRSIMAALKIPSDFDLDHSPCFCSTCCWT